MRGMRWFAVMAALLLAAVVGGVAYNAGLAHGLETSGKIAVVPWQAHVPWQPGFFFGPIVGLLFAFFVLRGIFGYGGWPRACRGAGQHPLERWHREAHERMDPQA
jgi:hypothetical protein